MAIGQIREVAGQAVGYTSLLIIGVPIVAAYNVRFFACKTSDKINELKEVAGNTYMFEREHGSSRTSASVMALESAVKHVFPDFSKRYEELCTKISGEDINRAREFHQGNLRH